MVFRDLVTVTLLQGIMLCYKSILGVCESLVFLCSLSDACAFLGMLSASLFSSLQWAVFSCFFIYFVIFLLLLLLKIGHLEEKQQPLPVFVDWLWAGFTLHQFPGCALGLEVSLSWKLKVFWGFFLSTSLVWALCGFFSPLYPHTSQFLNILLPQSVSPQILLRDGPLYVFASKLLP